MNDIHPTALIVGDVTLGKGNTIGPFVVIYGPTTIGDSNWIGTGVVIGAPPEVRSFQHPQGSREPAGGGGVRIGNGNTIREYAQIHQGWRSVTCIGDNAFIMNQTYIAHDCVLGDDVTLASSVLLAGHVHIGDGANLGLGTTVHQGRYVGAGAMVGMSTVVTRDLPPFAKAYGNPARIAGANTVGMQRRGIPDAAVEVLQAAYSGGGEVSLALGELESVDGLSGAVTAWWERPTAAAKF